MGLWYLAHGLLSENNEIATEFVVFSMERVVNIAAFISAAQRPPCSQ